MKKILLISILSGLILVGCNDKNDSSSNKRSEYNSNNITYKITAHSSIAKENKPSNKTTIIKNIYEQTKTNAATYNRAENIESASAQEQIEDGLPIITEFTGNDKSNRKKTVVSSSTSVKSEFSNVKKTESNADVIELPFVPVE